MLEFILLFIFFYFIINGFSKRKVRRKPRTLDAELRALINEHNTSTGIALDIKRFLLDIINDNNHDLEKFSDSRINQAQNLLDRAGPARTGPPWRGLWSGASGGHDRNSRCGLVHALVPQAL